MTFPSKTSTLRKPFVASSGWQSEFVSVFDLQLQVVNRCNDFGKGFFFFFFKRLKDLAYLMIEDKRILLPLSGHSWMPSYIGLS